MYVAAWGEKRKSLHVWGDRVYRIWEGSKGKCGRGEGMVRVHVTCGVGWGGGGKGIMHCMFERGEVEKVAAPQVSWRRTRQCVCSMRVGKFPPPPQLSVYQAPKFLSPALILIHDCPALLPSSSEWHAWALPHHILITTIWGKLCQEMRFSVTGPK